MSYSIRVKTRAGVAVIDGTTGTVPDGTFQISGHSDDINQSFQASHSNPDGTHTLTANVSEYTARRPTETPAAEQTTLT